MISTLVTGHEAVARTARELFPIVQQANDQPTADLLTQRLDIHEKAAWTLRRFSEAYGDRAVTAHRGEAVTRRPPMLVLLMHTLLSTIYHEK